MHSYVPFLVFSGPLVLGYKVWLMHTSRCGSHTSLTRLPSLIVTFLRPSTLAPLRPRWRLLPRMAPTPPSRVRPCPRYFFPTAAKLSDLYSLVGLEVESDYLVATCMAELDFRSCLVRFQGIFQFDMWGVKPGSGRWDWEALRVKVMKHGVKNSLLLAPMPTASTAQILGKIKGIFYTGIDPRLNG